MNKIVSTDFITDDVQRLVPVDATATTPKNAAVAKLMKAWEAKTTQRTAKGAGLTLMAVSLAACNDDNAVVVGDGEQAPVVTTGQTFTLTTGLDTIVGTAGNDTFNAGEVSQVGGVALTLTAGDTIDGGAGADTLNVATTAALNGLPAGVSVVNVETLNLTSGAGVTYNTTTSFTGLTTLNVTSADDVSVTAATTTNVAINSSALSGAAGDEVTVNGGNNVSVTASDTSTTAAASLNNIAIGGSTASAGTVSVTYTETVSDVAGTDAGIAGGSITTTGGTSVTVNSNATVGAASNAADVFTIGQVTVNGNASTTAVTVNQSAATLAFGGVNTNIKVTNGVVDINDLNTATKSDTITTVTLSNFGNSTFTGNALTTLNLTGGSSNALASGTLDIDQSAGLTTSVPTSLTINMVSGHVGAITDVDNQYTTLNVASAANSTIADLDFTNVTTLAVSGAGVTTVSALTDLAKATAITSSGGGLTITPTLATGTAFTGGAGVEVVSIAGTTKAINLGAGDDILTISTTTLGTGGSAAGGAGNDTLVANTNSSNIASLSTFSGFETLRVDGAAAQGAHVATGFTSLEVGALAGAASFTSVAAGVGITQLKTMAQDLTITLADATGTSDSVSLTLKSAGAIGAAGDTITLAGVETINITLNDTDTTAHVNVVELVATSATTVNVTGNAGLVYTNADATITTFDASGVSLAKVTDTGVTFDSTNTTVGGVVSIKGTNGVDTLTGSETANDTIIAGAGADTLVYDGGLDVFTGGAGNDTFDVNAKGTATVHLTIADLTAGDKIDVAGISGNNAATADASDIAVGALGAKIVLGAAATLANYLDAAAAATTGATKSIAKHFQFDGNTFLVIDNSVNTTFTAGTDAVVKITGLIDLSASTFDAASILTTVDVV